MMIKTWRFITLVLTALMRRRPSYTNHHGNRGITMLVKIVCNPIN